MVGSVMPLSRFITHRRDITCPVIPVLGVVAST